MVTRSLQEGTDYTVTYEGLKQGKLTVPAGGEAVCTVTLALTESRKEQILKDFPNGNYVEGYVSLTPEGEGVPLGLPYLGFYADWEQAPLFDGPLAMARSAKATTARRFWARELRKLARRRLTWHVNWRKSSIPAPSGRLAREPSVTAAR